MYGGSGGSPILSITVSSDSEELNLINLMPLS
jgi:hypothetical protein